MAKINSAIQFATMQHGTQKRKGKEVPYIVHPLEVMEILYRMGADENLLVAGILHDVVEDTAVKIADIREYFGDDVAELVAAHTEDKSEPWEVRARLKTVMSLEQLPDAFRCLCWLISCPTSER